MGPSAFTAAAMPCVTEASASTSMAMIVIGNFSLAAVAASCGAPAGFRMVAATAWPARAKASAVSYPMPLLQPVMSTVDLLRGAVLIVHRTR